MATITSLPPELLTKILSCLNFSDLSRFECHDLECVTLEIIRQHCLDKNHQNPSMSPLLDATGRPLSLSIFRVSRVNAQWREICLRIIFKEDSMQWKGEKRKKILLALLDAETSIRWYEKEEAERRKRVKEAVQKREAELARRKEQGERSDTDLDGTVPIWVVLPFGPVICCVWMLALLVKRKIYDPVSRTLAIWAR